MATGSSSVSTRPRTLVDKLWDAHVVVSGVEQQPDVLYVDMHYIHEMTSAQAFAGLSEGGRQVRRPDLTVAVEDHIVPTVADRGSPLDDVAVRQLKALRSNCASHGITHHKVGTKSQGIVHVIGPELGLSQPGMSIVCGDSHTSTHGALGALAFGIGTSQVEHVLATQCIRMKRPRTLQVDLPGDPAADVTAKDLALNILHRIGNSGGRGSFIEYTGEVVRGLSIEGRMTLCNMSIECGSRGGLIAPDDRTLEYLSGRAHTPTGEAWQRAVTQWKELCTDEGASFDESIVLDAAAFEPYVTWGTNPAQSVALGGCVPDANDLPEGAEREAAQRALEYMGLTAGQAVKDLHVDVVFLGSCTNGRLEDLRAAAQILRGRRVAPGTRMLVVPGSMAVREQAEVEGLDRIFTEAGAQWRLPGCSMCVAINADELRPGERCVSTSNRNFEGRQGAGGRTHLASPQVAAASATAGRIVREADL